MKAEERAQIVNAIFGKHGMMSSEGQVSFEERAAEVEDIIKEIAPAFLKHYEADLMPILNENIQTAWKYPLLGLHWTNNNCESMNNILKMSINWTPQSLPTLIDTIYDIVRSHYVDVERAIIRRGNFRLAPGFEQLAQPRELWRTKTKDRQARHMEKFFKMPKLVDRHQTAVSSDGNLHIYSAPGGGKKKNQIKRKRAAKTRPNKRVFVDDSDSE